MSGAVGLLLRILGGFVALGSTWAIFDLIHDRNTEVAVACLGLAYCLFAAISRRWQYFGFSLTVLPDVAAARSRNEPYDMGLRDETGLKLTRGVKLVTQAAFATLAALCAFRLATSLSGHGWERLSAPLRPLVASPWLTEWLQKL